MGGICTVYLHPSLKGRKKKRKEQNKKKRRVMGVTEKEILLYQTLQHEGVGHLICM